MRLCGLSLGIPNDDIRPPPRLSVALQGAFLNIVKVLVRKLRRVGIERVWCKALEKREA
jgi:hypothetical protein